MTNIGAILAWCLLAGLATACGPKEPFVWFESLPSAAHKASTYKIRAGDEIVVSVWNQPQITGPRRVRSDGFVTVTLVGDVLMAGQTTRQAAEVVALKLKAGGMVQDPRVDIEILASRAGFATVIGEVRHPGQFELLPGDSVLDFLSKGGGLTEFARTDGVYILRKSDPSAPRVRFDYKRLTASSAGGIAFPLQDGDIVVVE